MTRALFLAIGFAVASAICPAVANAQQPFAFVGAARTAALAAQSDSAPRLASGPRLFPTTDCASVRIVFTVLGAGAGLGVGLAADLVFGIGGAISRDAATPILILTTLSGAGLGYLVANQTAPCA